MNNIHFLLQCKHQHILAQLAPDDVFALLQNISFEDSPESAIDFDDVAQDHTEIVTNPEPSRVPEQIIDSQEIERKEQLEMRHELESWAKNLLHLLKDLDEPGKSSIVDNYIKEVRNSVRQLPAAPSRTELKQTTTRKQVKVNRSFIPVNATSTEKKSRRPKEPTKEVKSLWETAVENAPLEDPLANNWADILSLNKKRVFEAAEKVFEKSIEKTDNFNKAYQAARVAWKCNDCIL